MVGLLVCLGVAGVPAAAGAQEVTEQPAEQQLEARILAQRHEEGEVEFVVQFREEGEPWSESAEPPRRFLPPGAEVDVWFASSPLMITVDAGSPSAYVAGEVRVVVQRLADDRIEFALQTRLPGETWGERLLPARRFFPADAEVGRWLVSAPVAVTLAASPSPTDPGAVQVSRDVLDFDMIDVHTGETVNIRSVVTGQTPLLFWLWSPH
ncbi:MAG: hypothetical protein F4121_07490 [Acidimicrobiia bacterium]|nr:hypothetical protein [Acidimicrobiia bacterium]MYC45426.1 hypothetical protein [Acidimicrobiia bacterium]MYI19903.1 hypothetical protein [Acidimicrobiia bacterium]